MSRATEVQNTAVQIEPDTSKESRIYIPKIWNEEAPSLPEEEVLL